MLALWAIRAACRTEAPKNPKQKGLDFNQLLVKNPPLKTRSHCAGSPLSRQCSVYAAIITCFAARKLPDDSQSL